MRDNLWLLTEEKPKKSALLKIINTFLTPHGFSAKLEDLRVIPVLDETDRFTSKYQVLGVQVAEVEAVFIKIISGNSSFVDYLIFLQPNEPEAGQRPILAIEETKTDDSESRNTGVFQRATKFVYVDIFFPGLSTAMFYNAQIKPKEKATQTNIFGSKCLRALGVDLVGKSDDYRRTEPFRTVDELIAFKSSMRPPPPNNVPIRVEKQNNLITISGRLYKKGALAHDPNIGALSLISATLRKLGWSRGIQITQHGLQQNHLNPKNKFVQIANHLNVDLQGLKMPKACFPDFYWRFEVKGEKLVTIFVHVVVEEFSPTISIYANHAGAERGYFYAPGDVPIAVSKRVVDSSGKMRKNSPKIAIPDLILLDPLRRVIVSIEGEQAKNVALGVQQLGEFRYIEDNYIRKFYPDYELSRSIVLFGGRDAIVTHRDVGFLLTSNGEMAVGPDAPSLLADSLENLKAYGAKRLPYGGLMRGQGGV